MIHVDVASITIMKMTLQHYNVITVKNTMLVSNVMMNYVITLLSLFVSAIHSQLCVGNVKTICPMNNINNIIALFVRQILILGANYTNISILSLENSFI